MKRIERENVEFQLVSDFGMTVELYSNDDFIQAS